MFEKETDLILKITNLFLIIWLIGSTVFFYSSIVNLVMNDSYTNGFEYAELQCEDSGYSDNKKTCDELYLNFKTNERNTIRGYKINLFTSFGSIVIVTGSIYFLNRRKDVVANEVI